MKTFKRTNKGQKENAYSIDVVKERHVAIYVRESSKQQAKEGYNIHDQEEKCIDYVKAMLDDVQDIKNDVKIYREKGYSAKTVTRPVLDQLIIDIKRGKIKTLVVQRLDRLVRRNIGMYELMDLFEDYNVRLISLRESIDTTSATWKIVVSVNTMLAEIEQDNISERVEQALEYGVKQGSYIKGGYPPFGTVRERVYLNDDHDKHIITLKPHPFFWDILKSIFDLAYHGNNCCQISAIINSHPVMIANEKKLSEDSIERILSNKIYYGIQMFKGNEYEVKFDGCFTKDYWCQTQINRSIHLKRETKLDYLYHGKVFCECGTQCIVDASKKRLADGTYKHYKYYVCPHCGRRISEVSICETVESKLCKYYDENIMGKNRDKQRNKIENLDNLYDDLCDMYINDKIDKGYFKRQVERCQMKKDKLTNNLRKKQKKYTKLTKSERDEFITDNIKSIMITNKKRIEISYLS